MSKMKTGDVVRVKPNLDKTNLTYGLNEEMYKMIGREYPITSLKSNQIAINGYFFDIEDLELISSTNTEESFVDALIAGKNIHNPASRGVDNGKFIGYAISFGAEEGHQVKTYTIVDENGYSLMTVDPIYTYTDTFRVKFEVQPEKTKMHTVAFNCGVPADWKVVTLSDEALGNTKRSWSEYRILETWSE